MARKTIGILGGMGPEATADLFLKIIRATPAHTDQEHLRIIVDNNPQIPDRTAAIVGQGADPFPFLLDTARNLVQAGADFLVIPCNTAHYYYEKLQDHCAVPIINMIEECTRRAVEVVPNLVRVGLLATTGTIAAGLYDQAFQRRGVQVDKPLEEELGRIMEVIYGIKEGRPGRQLRPLWMPAVKGLLGRKAQALVLGCTELPLAIGPEDIPIPVLNPTEILAQVAVAYACGNN